VLLRVTTLRHANVGRGMSSYRRFGETTILQNSCYRSSNHTSLHRRQPEYFKLRCVALNVFIFVWSENVRTSLLTANVVLFTERVLRDDDRPLEILQEWGPHQDQVKLILRYTVLPSAMNGKCRILFSRVNSV
jgi:hypothetical protein